MREAMFRDCVAGAAYLDATTLYERLVRLEAISNTRELACELAIA